MGGGYCGLGRPLPEGRGRNLDPPPPPCGLLIGFYNRD